MNALSHYCGPRRLKWPKQLVLCYPRELVRQIFSAVRSKESAYHGEKVRCPRPVSAVIGAQKPSVPRFTQAWDRLGFAFNNPRCLEMSQHVMGVNLIAVQKA